MKHLHCPPAPLQIEDMIAENERIVCRNRWLGTNSRTGKHVEFHGFVEWRFEGNRIAERWATVAQPTELAYDARCQHN